MATERNSSTARVLKFTGRWQGSTKPIPSHSAEARAFYDARLICGAKRDNDDWTARLLLVLLETLTIKQRELLEFRLIGPSLSNLDNVSARQALAVVRLVNGDKGHRERVRNALRRVGVEGVQ
jgi:hypothetical protein